MKRKGRTFEIDVHSDSEFDYYLSGADRLAVFPKETDIKTNDIILVNNKFTGNQTACFVRRIAPSHRMNDTYKVAYLNSIYPE